MGHVETLILSSEFPSVFAFPVDADSLSACKSTANVILNFPCTKSHSEQCFDVVFPKSLKVRLLDTTEPVCFENPVNGVLSKVARMTIRKKDDSAASDFASIKGDQYHQSS